ncbi:MAG: SGNH/GDSL hydrolase family protein [Clostridia bacterium]|nr:SGNH/GDSL hydrolase family protein [Clostridia bacterium]
MYDILKGKTLVAIGDSLFEGNKLGNAATWVNKMERYGMTVYNYGKNGNTMAKQEKETKVPPMCERYAQMQDGADYVVVLGGANDKRLSVPLGENDSTDPTTFKGALRQMILGLTAKYPKAKILFMTNYNRWPSKNELGISDIDYVLAMEEICRIYSIPCFNNYYNAGISFHNPAQSCWIDEGLVLGINENRHFSNEAYDWLLPKYAALLAAL